MGPQRFKGEGRWWLSTWGGAHFATRMGLSVAVGEHKVHRGASSSHWWRLVEEGKRFLPALISHKSFLLI